MKIIKLLLISLQTALVLGCSTVTTYNAADKYGHGYVDRQVDGALHRVSYTARAYTDFETIYTYTVFRAAELARAQGATHFEVLEGGANMEAVNRFVARPVKVSSADFHDSSVFPMPVQTRTYTQTQIFIPIAPPPPPIQVSLLIRLLNAPSLNPALGFEVNDILTRVGPKIIRPVV